MRSTDLTRFVLAAALLAGTGLAPPCALADPVPAAVGLDPPTGAQPPAGLEAVGVPSGGVRINAVLYTAAGQGPHPTVLLLHGFPGNEQNLDLAQAMRRDGWTVLTLHYRGSWGSPGTFSFAHCLEDARAALAWLRAPDGGVAHGADPGKIVVVGHSMGGWIAAETMIADPGVLGGALVSMADVGVLGAMPRAELARVLDDNLGTASGAKPLQGASAEALAEEAGRNAEKWRTIAGAKAIGRRPLLVVTSDDGLAAQSDALLQALEGGEDPGASKVHLASDHSYSGARIALAAAVLRWLENLPGAPAGL